MTSPMGLQLGWVALGWLVAACEIEYVLDASECSAGLALCQGACVDLLADPSHCGRCSGVCPVSQACVAGACVPDCAPGTERCELDCVDTQSSPAHCGDCETACRDGRTCLAGVCVDLCEGACDPQLETCVAGDCECRAGLSRCGASCVDTDADPLHCGVCDGDCAGQACADGSCSADGCVGFPDRCGDACTDTDRNPLHCGDCDVRCAADSVCYQGQCAFLPPTSCTSCPCDACDRSDATCHDPAPFGPPVCVPGDA